MEYIILFFLWAAFCALHSILASTKWKQYAEVRMGDQFRWYRLLYNLFALAGLVAIIVYQVKLGRVSMFERTRFFDIAAWMMMGTGLLIMIVCIRAYIIDLSGIYSTDKKAGGLRTTGFHQFIRHPLYLGTFILLWGIWLAWPFLSIFISNCTITVYTIVAIEWEEKKLLQQFGSSYKHYQQTVPKLIPRIRF